MRTVVQLVAGLSDTTWEVPWCECGSRRSCLNLTSLLCVRVWMRISNNIAQSCCTQLFVKVYLLPIILIIIMIFTVYLLFIFVCTTCITDWAGLDKKLLCIVHLQTHNIMFNVLIYMFGLGLLLYSSFSTWLWHRVYLFFTPYNWMKVYDDRSLYSQNSLNIVSNVICLNVLLPWEFLVKYLFVVFKCFVCSLLKWACITDSWWTVFSLDTK